MIGVHGLEIIREIAREETRRRAGQHPDPLQCRLAGHGRLGHRDLADLSRVEAGIPSMSGSTKPGPRNQGALLTAWEMVGHGMPHT
jgi:methylthioribose-1-phosphate isomerase